MSLLGPILAGRTSDQSENYQTHERRSQHKNKFLNDTIEILSRWNGLEVKRKRIIIKLNPFDKVIMFGIESSGPDKEEDDDDDWVKYKNDTQQNRGGEDDCLGQHCPISKVKNCPQLHLIERDGSHDATVLVIIMWQEIL